MKERREGETTWQPSLLCIRHGAESQVAECPARTASQIWCIPYINISPTLDSHRQHRWSRYQAVLIDMVSQVAPDTPWPDLDRLGWENEFASNWAAGGPNTPSDSDAKLVLSSQSAGDNEKILWHHTLTGLLSNDLCQVNWNFLFLIFNLKSVCP